MQEIGVPARRQALKAGIMMVGGLVMSGSKLSAADSSASAGLHSIHMEEDFTVPAPQIYQALLDSKQFREFSGAAATIDRAPGGTFTLFDGKIAGRNIELIPNQRVLQAWRELNWGDGIYSIVKFDLKPQGAGTRIVFDHWGFPEEGRAHLIIGWKEHYWDRMRTYFKS